MYFWVWRLPGRSCGSETRHEFFFFILKYIPTIWSKFKKNYSKIPFLKKLVRFCFEKCIIKVHYTENCNRKRNENNLWLSPKYVSFCKKKVPSLRVWNYGRWPILKILLTKWYLGQVCTSKISLNLAIQRWDFKKTWFWENHIWRVSEKEIFNISITLKSHISVSSEDKKSRRVSFWKKFYGQYKFEIAYQVGPFIKNTTW